MSERRFGDLSIIVLVVLNFLVLFGQFFPEAAPETAPTVTVIFLILNMVFLIASWRRSRDPRERE